MTTSPDDTMRAVVADRYGGPEVLRVVDLPVPTPGGEGVANGDLAAHIDRRIRLDQVPEALVAVGAGEVLGKVVVEMGEAPTD